MAVRSGHVSPSIHRVSVLSNGTVAAGPINANAESSTSLKTSTTTMSKTSQRPAAQRSPPPPFDDIEDADLSTPTPEKTSKRRRRVNYEVSL